MSNTVQTQVTLPPSVGYDVAERKRKLAEAMMAKAVAPRQTPVGPTWGYLANGLTQLGEALLARNARKDADKAELGADAQMRGQNQNAIEQLAGATQIDSVDGEAATPLATGGVDRNAQQMAASQQMQGGLNAATSGMDPRDANKVLAQALLQRQMPQAPEAYTLGEGQRRFVGDRMVAENPKPVAPPEQNWDTQEQVLPDGRIQLMSYDKKSNTWTKQGEPYKPIDKNPNVNSGNGGGLPPRWVQAQDPTDPNRTVWVNLNDPKSSGPPTGKETAGGKRENDLQFSMRGADSIMQEAEDLLTGTVRDATGKVDPTAKGEKPTGSMFGKGVDVVAGLVGASPDGAKEADRLKAVGSWLATKVPRFQGPQSDKDTAMYKEMAAQLGDATVPVERRLAALQTVRGIIATYQKQGQDVWAERQSPSGAAPPAGKTEEWVRDASGKLVRK